MSDNVVLVVLVPSPKSRLISLMFLVVILPSVVVSLSGVLAGMVSDAGVSVMLAVRCVVLETAMMS